MVLSVISLNSNSLAHAVSETKFNLLLQRNVASDEPPLCGSCTLFTFCSMNSAGQILAGIWVGARTQGEEKSIFTVISIGLKYKFSGTPVATSKC